MKISREKYIIRQSMLKLADQIRPFSATGFVVLNWVENYTDVDQYSGRYNKFPGRKTNRKHIEQDWEIAVQAIDRIMEDDGYSDIDYIDKNIELLASTINATSDEIELLNVLIRKELDRDDFEDYCDKLISDFNLSSVKALSLLCDLDASTIKEITKASSPLKKVRHNFIYIILAFSKRIWCRAEFRHYKSTLKPY